MAKQGILLESGTNEVELLEFLLAGQGFGINVAKIQAIEQYDQSKITAVPQAPDSLAGVLLFRNTSIPLIDLAYHLGITDSFSTHKAGDEDAQELRVVLVMEFNGVTSAVIADGVDRIHRISWNEISPLSSVLIASHAEFTGSVNIEGREVLILDIEKIVGDIIPSACLQDLTNEQLDTPQASSRGEVRIILAEDSGAIASMIRSVLAKGGYDNLDYYDNGQSALDAILAEGDQITQPTLVISDIEMPQMDGLTLCRNLKTKYGRALPVVMFSSLINEQMAAKCESVGADFYISKPEIDRLIDQLDQLALQPAA